MTNFDEYLTNKVAPNNAMKILKDFLDLNEGLYQSKRYDEMDLVGYILDINFAEVRLITNDAFKRAVGGVPRNSFLIMVPESFGEYNPHFTLLRVLDAAPTPLTSETQQTYFQLYKQSMPEIEIFTQSELQWGAMKAQVLGMFYPDPDDITKIEFASDMVNIMSAHKYRVYSPNNELIDQIVNSSVSSMDRFSIGYLRQTENRLVRKKDNIDKMDVYVSPSDFIGNRTAMLGKTRQGKSNTIKIVVESIIQNPGDSNVGQIIFDINGEYANDNPQDDNYSLKTQYSDTTTVYALNPRKNSGAKPLKTNYYEEPEVSIQDLRNLLLAESISARYVKNFVEVQLTPIDEIMGLKKPKYNEFRREKRKLLIYWAILKKAGFNVDENKLLQNTGFKNFNPNLSKGLRKAIHDVEEEKDLPSISSLNDLIREYEALQSFMSKNKKSDLLLSSGKSKKPLFDPENITMLEFLNYRGLGPAYLKPFTKYHDLTAQNAIDEIVEELENGRTVIIDFGNAPQVMMRFKSEHICKAIFYKQTEKFTNDDLGNNFIQFYFEEAHNIFPRKERNDEVDIYQRIAKEGAKYQIGLLYSTQSPSTINQDLMAQTDNFFISHISSRTEVDYLGRNNVEFEGIKEDILKTKRKGYSRILTISNRYVIPVQIRKFELNKTESD